MLQKFTTKDSLSSRQFQENLNLNLYRSNFGQDRDRIIESNAFRRLQYKTQVFVNFHGDHYRTRLTHSLEVAQISRWIASGLNLNKDLAEIISLAHDLGHAPFGHAGEDALNEKIQEFNPGHEKFCHNAQAIKIITDIENRFLEFKGLNLCKETLEGIAKHNGNFKNKQIHPIISRFNNIFDLDLYSQPSLEAQISACADDLAYNNHDLEDGIKDNLFTLEDLKKISLFNYVIKQINNEFVNINKNQTIGEMKKRLTSIMVIDIIKNSAKNIEIFNIRNFNDIKYLDHFIIAPSKVMSDHLKQISSFLYSNMYTHPKVKEMSLKAQHIVSNLFDHYIDNYQEIPQQFRLDNQPILSAVDYIAGMTDRFAINKYNEIAND